MIKETIDSFFSKSLENKDILQTENGLFLNELWVNVNDLGFTKIVCREEKGGVGGEWSDAFYLFYSVGFYQIPLPLPEAIIGNFIFDLFDFDIDDNNKISIISGGKSFGLVEENGKINGKSNNVKWARNCDYFLVEIDNKIFVINNSSNVEISEGVDEAVMPADTVFFNNSEAILLGESPYLEIPNFLYSLYALALSAMLAGALQAALNLSIQYVKDRSQFGKPIGKNQAIQNQLAVLAGEVACSYAASKKAFSNLPLRRQDDASKSLFNIAVSKIITSDAVEKSTSIAHQVHGAIGFTYEYPLNFITRRLWAWRYDGGSSKEWAILLGTSFIENGPVSFWENVVSNKLKVI